MIKVYIILGVYIISPLLIILLFRRYQFVKKVGTVILAYAVGIVMSLMGFVPEGEAADTIALQEMQKWLTNLSVPIAIPLMLFSSDFRLWAKSLPKTMAAMLGGILSIVISVVAAFFIFRNSDIADLPNVAAMMTGIYTGGTMNFYALGQALHVSPSTITMALTFEMVATFPFLILIVSGGYKFVRKLLPYSDQIPVTNQPIREFSEETLVENYHNMLTFRIFPKMMLGLLLSILCLCAGAGLSMLITGGKLNEMIIILTITSLAIALSFVKKIRLLPKTFELGMFFILIFSVVVASQFNIYSIKQEGLSLFLFILFILFLSVILHLIFSRIGKVSGDLFAVAHIGLLCSPPFIPPVVSAIKNRKVLISGIVIGLVGYAVGTYLGVLLAYVFSKI
jgi:uncharacterized membrane protein